eukprot:10972791-Alexandrium_andersonii.AAC.1
MQRINALNLEPGASRTASGGAGRSQCPAAARQLAREAGDAPQPAPPALRLDLPPTVTAAWLQLLQ